MDFLFPSLPAQSKAHVQTSRKGARGRLEPEAGCSQEAQSLENSQEIIHRCLGIVSIRSPKHNHTLIGILKAIYPKKKHVFSLTHSARMKRSDLPKIYTFASLEDSLSGWKVHILNHSTTWSSIKRQKTFLVGYKCISSMDNIYLTVSWTLLTQKLILRLNLVETG